MGTSPSRPSPLAPAFQCMHSWELKKARQLLEEYKEKDMDFGLDARTLADLLHGDKEWAERIIDAFGSTNGIINALAFICGAILVSSGAALEKAELVFDALDFDATEQISMDEMTIVFLCCARGVSVLSGVGSIPCDEDLESVTLQAYRERNKSSGQSISKAEFTKWVLQFASGGPNTSLSSEVSLEKTMQQFGLTSQVPQAEDEQANNTSSFLDIPARESTKDTSDTNEVGPDQKEHEERTVSITDQSMMETQDSQVHADDGFATGESYEQSQQAPPEPEEPIKKSADDYSTNNDQENERVYEDDEEFTQNAENSYDQRQLPSDKPRPHSPTYGEHEPADPQPTRESEQKVDYANHDTTNDAHEAEPDDYDQEFAQETPRNNENAPDQIQKDAPPSENEFADEKALVSTGRSEEDDATPLISVEGMEEQVKADKLPTDEKHHVEFNYEADNEPPSGDLDATYEDDSYEDSTTAAVEIDTNVNELRPASSSELAKSAKDTEIPIDASIQYGSTTNLNEYDTYDYTAAEFDGSSGLPPPEPRELEDDVDNSEHVPYDKSDGDETSVSEKTQEEPLLPDEIDSKNEQ